MTRLFVVLISLGLVLAAAPCWAQSSSPAAGARAMPNASGSAPKTPAALPEPMPGPSGKKFLPGDPTPRLKKPAALPDPMPKPEALPEPMPKPGR